MHAGPAKVGVDQGDAVAGLREHDGKVRRRGGLALAGHRAGDLDHADRSVEPEELHVGAQPAVGLDGDVAGLADGDRSIVGRRVDRDDGEHRLVDQRLEVVLGTDLVVEVVEQERGAETDQQPDDGGEDGRARRRRLDRHRRNRRPT